MIRMAMDAFRLRCIRLKPVKSPTHLTVCGNFLVARDAQPGLRSWRERLVTVAALLLELGMSGDDRPGHDELFEQALRLQARRYRAGHADPDHERTNEWPAQPRASTQKKCAAKT